MPCSGPVGAWRKSPEFPDRTVIAINPGWSCHRST